MRTQNLRIIIPSIGREEIAKTLEAIISDAESNLDTVTTTVTIIADGKVAYEILESFLKALSNLPLRM
jgi:ketosteroid isomerase-like protein